MLPFVASTTIHSACDRSRQGMIVRARRRERRQRSDSSASAAQSDGLEAGKHFLSFGQGYSGESYHAWNAVIDGNSRITVRGCSIGPLPLPVLHRRRQLAPDKTRIVGITFATY